MIKYVVKRILLMMLTLFVILSLCFVFIKLLPLPPVSGSEATVQRVEERRELMGYYKPLIEQFFLFWKRIFTQFDWGMGENIYPVQEVTKIIGEKLPATITVNLYSLLISIPVGLLLGIYAAVRKNKWQDHTISVVVMLFISVPSFVYAFLVQYLLCYKLQWFPMVAEKGLSLTDPKMIWSLMPAVISLAFGTIAQLTRYTRAELSEVLTSEFMLLARTKGLTRRQATMRHALRNSMVPIFPMILGEFIGILSGSLVIESIFNIPGIGDLYVKSVNSLDYNFFMAISAFYTAIGLAAGIIIDLSYGFIDPRIRMGVK
ncbi:MAG: ABC transporter permease [Candidatus Borkfalkiaceae bacterium]|nr:ABC transporter permease [Christensenellaceae bacterium]